jgi:hypothetical protein
MTVKGAVATHYASSSAEETVWGWRRRAENNKASNGKLRQASIHLLTVATIN